MTSPLRRALLAVLLCTVPACDPSSSRAQGGYATVSAAEPRQSIRDTVAAEARALGRTLSLTDAAQLVELYDRRTGSPLWITEDGTPTREARAALALLRDSGADGLRPDDYAAEELTTLAATLDAPPATTAGRFDVLLSASLMRFYRHLHLGRTDPRTLGVQLTIPTDEHDFAAVLLSALDGGGVVETAARLMPPFAQYRALKAALARYRALAETAAPLPAFTSTLHPGDHDAGARALAERLVALGDLAIGTPLPEDVYTPALSEGVVRFQQRHGLDPDGVLGRATAAALGVPLTWRVRQLEFALERLRWLPDLTGSRVLFVNVPMFRLWAWEAVPSANSPRLDMAVIVGRALDTRTPVFSAPMRFVVFRPYWNVPPSILRKEMLPQIRRSPDYLRREHLEIVRGQADSSPVVPLTPESVADLARGTARLRQQPGSFNALGLIKFMFPNENDVYLHGTPAAALFRHSRRDFSHGCIRVEDPVGLAEWVLERQPEWNRQAILEAMQGRDNRRVDLIEPVQVMIFYTTAAIMPGDAGVHFAMDVYEQDRALESVW